MLACVCLYDPYNIQLDVIGSMQYFHMACFGKKNMSTVKIQLIIFLYKIIYNLDSKDTHTHALNPTKRTTL